jgi:preprotein translocase subunit SecD
MTSNLRWKLIAILVVVALAVVAFYPPKDKVKLGLDLKGGVELILQVQTDDALRLETDTSVEQLREALKTAGITVGTLRSTSLTEFVAEGVPQASDAQFRQVAQDNLGLAYDREAGAGGTHTFRMKPNIAVQRRSEAVTQAIQTIDRRVNELGVSEPVVAPSGTAQDRILVQLPGVTDIARAKNIIGSRTLLEIKLVEAGPASDEATLLAPYGGKLPPDMQVLKGAGVDRTDTGTYYYLVNRVAAITGRDLRNARTMVDEIGQPGVLFTLNNEGVSKFTRVTGDNVGRQLAIVLDDFVRSAPSIRERISRADANITGSFSQQEAADLALVLRSGALPASLTYLAESTVGPTLGEESIRAGILASLTGLALVTLFMLVYYRLAGFNAFLAITINLIILLGFMAYLGAAMTLPGIAGFILTIGMGVDSNVLIFERIREELALKKGARQAIAAGFDRVFVTIVDTHVASLIAAAFLFQFGTGPIRGFATTLFFGLITNVFTAVFVSRTLFELTLSRKPAGSAQQLSI